MTRSTVSLNGTARTSGAKLLLSLSPLGRLGLARALDHYMDVTTALYSCLQEDGHWSFVAPPLIPHLTFRPEGVSNDELESMHASLLADGWELSLTRWRDLLWFRFILCRPKLEWRRLASDLISRRP